MRRRTVLVAAVGLVAAVAIGLAVVSIVDWDSPRLGAAVLGKVSELAGVEIEATEFRLDLLRGLELRGVEARGTLAAGVLEASMDRLVLEHRLLPLLSGQVVVDRLVLERPNLRLMPPPAAASGSSRSVSTAAVAAAADEPAAAPASAVPAAGGDLEAGGGLEISLVRLAIEDGTLVVHEEGAPAPSIEMSTIDLELRDLRLDPRASSALTGLSAEGELTAGPSTLAAIRARELSGELVLAGGHLILREVEMPANLGRFSVSELDVDLGSDPFRFAVALSGDPLDASELLGVAANALGSTSLELVTTGGLGESLELDGRGALSFAGGSLPDAPVLAAIERLLPKVPVVGALYQPFDIRFALAGERVVVELFEIVAGDLRLQAQGAVGLDGTFDLSLGARAPRELLESPEIPDEVLEALTDAEGLVRLPILVRGDRDDPTARFDRSQWASLARERLREEAGKELQKQVGRLLGGRRNRGGD